MKLQDNLLKISFLISTLILSFVAFYYVFTYVDFNMILFIFDATLFIIFLSFLNCINICRIIKIFIFGLALMAGLILARNVSDIPFPIHCILIFLFFVETMICIACLLCFLRKKTPESSEVRFELYPEHSYDLERLEEYLHNFTVVGVNGTWGSGKSIVVDKFCYNNSSDYNIIKIEPLTCNLETIDAFLFRQLEDTLFRNRIYPKYSRKVRRMLSNSKWATGALGVIIPDSDNNLTVFDGFCKDLDNLKKPVLIVYEDLDRISSEHRDQLAKLLDITFKLQEHNVKVIYELDQQKMSKLGFDRDYIEKYIPYIVNISTPSARTMIATSLDELGDMRVTDLSYEDFAFLFRSIHMETFLQKIFGYNDKLELDFENMTPRKIKSFVSEVNTTLRRVQFSKREYRQTVITYNYLKHFLNNIYDALSFEGDMIDELKLTRYFGPDRKFSYSVQQMVDNCRIGESRAIQYDEESSDSIFGFTAEDIKDFFEFTDDPEKDEIVKQNRVRLGLLISFGYYFQFEDEERIRDLMIDTHKSENLIHNQDLMILAHITHNDKVSRIIKNLHSNGRSESTNVEAVVKTFCECVLNQERTKWQDCWIDFLNRATNKRLFKDNGTIFRIGVNPFVSLFQAISLYFNSYNLQETQKRQIIMKALELYQDINSDTDSNVLTLDKVAIYRCCNIDNRDIYIRILELFRSLDVKFNFSRESVYRNFLKEYIDFAFKWGYLKGYDNYQFSAPIEDDDSKEYKKFIIRQLNGYLARLSRSLKTSKYPDQLQREYILLKDFIIKNLEIIDTTQQSPQPTVSIRMEEHTEAIYQNKEVYEHLKASIKDKDFADQLIQAYTDGNINMREYDMLQSLQNNSIK